MLGSPAIKLFRSLPTIVAIHSNRKRVTSEHAIHPKQVRKPTVDAITCFFHTKVVPQRFEQPWRQFGAVFTKPLKVMSSLACRTILRHTIRAASRRLRCLRRGGPSGACFGNHTNGTADEADVAAIITKALLILDRRRRDEGAARGKWSRPSSPVPKHLNNALAMSKTHTATSLSHPRRSGGTETADRLSKTSKEVSPVSTAVRAQAEVDREHKVRELTEHRFE